MKMTHIIKLFSEKREVFEENHHLFIALPNLDNEIKLLLNLIKKYYEQYPDHNYIGPTELKNFYDLQYPNSRDKDIYHDLIQMSSDAEISTSIMKDLMEQGVEMSYAQNIVKQLLPVMQGSKFGVLSSIKEQVDEFHQHLKNPPRATNRLEASTSSPSELVKSALYPEGAPWIVETLNMIIGPVQSKTLGTIFGFVESGKTSFILSNLVSMAYHFRETGEQICFLGNEEGARRVHERLLTAFIQKSKDELKEEKDFDAEKEVGELGFHRIKVFDQIGHINQVRKCLDEWGPKIVVIDQGTKVYHDIKCRDTDTIRVLYNMYRNLAVEYDCAIITIEQGVGEAENRQWLRLSDIYNSRVGLQGELDYAIGIGKIIDKASRENLRYFHVSKNKLYNGDKIKFAMVFDHERCMWKPM